MKKILCVSAVCCVLMSFVSCAKQLKDPDLVNKGIIKAKIVTRQDFAQFSTSRLFFRKLDDPSKLSEGSIMTSEVYDGDSIAINVVPGSYVLFAGLRTSTDSIYLIFLTDEAMQKTCVELKAGETVDLGTIYLEERKANLLGNVTPVEKKNQEDVIRAYESLIYTSVLGDLEQWRYKDKNKEAEKKKEEEKEKEKGVKIEEFK